MYVSLSVFSSQSDDFSQSPAFLFFHTQAFPVLSLYACVCVCIYVGGCVNIYTLLVVWREENVLSYWEGLDLKKVFSDVTHMLVELQLMSI